MSYRRTQVKKLKRKSHNLQALQMRSSLSKKILKSKKEYSTAGLQNREISKTCHFDYPAFYHISKCTSKNSMALLSLETLTTKKNLCKHFFLYFELLLGNIFSKCTCRLAQNFPMCTPAFFCNAQNVL